MCEKKRPVKRTADTGDNNGASGDVKSLHNITAQEKQKQNKKIKHSHLRGYEALEGLSSFLWVPLELTHAHVLQGACK